MTPKNNFSVNRNDLIEKFINNSCTREEFDQLLSLVENERELKELTEALKFHWNKTGTGAEHNRDNLDNRFELMMQGAKSHSPVLSMTINRVSRKHKALVAVAASILLIVLPAYLFFDGYRGSTQIVSHKPAEQIVRDFDPGGNRAVLTLSDGSTVLLDSVQNGTLARQGNSNIIKSGNGQISYRNSGEPAVEISYNTVSTPRGGQYRIDLADGSKVWLNAASSLKFPTTFAGKTRNVVLTGEGYFEVKKNLSMPFHVIVNDVKVEVLGTHFNVNAYNDEDAVATTLVEGSVKVTKPSALPATRSVIIRPGQRAESNESDQITVVDDADVEEAVAWKNGKFQFNSADIQTIMRQLGRWYDVNIQYEGHIPKRQFTGKISRNVSASKLISMLEYANIHVRIEGKNIVVTP